VIRRGWPIPMALLALGACSLTFDATKLGVPVTMASAASDPTTAGAFKVSRHATYVFWGAVPVGTPSLERALATQLIAGKGVADLRIRVHSSVGDLLFTMLTLGLVVPRTVTYEGVIVDGLQPGPAALPPPATP
jgi:hypothetical protein